MEPRTTYHESELLHRLANEEEDAFTIIYRRYYFRVYSYAKRWLSERQDAEDVTADTFVKLWNRKERFHSLENVSAFLFVTARNACIDFLRHRKVQTSKEDELLKLIKASEANDFAVQEIREEFLKMVYAQVEKMPERMKEIFLLSYRDGLKPSAIAALLDLKVQTVSNQKNNAIQLLIAAFANRPMLLAMLLLLESHTTFQA